MGYVNTPAGQIVGVVPDANEDPNLPADLLAIAKAIEKRVCGIYATAAIRDSATVAAGLEQGMMAFVKADNSVWFYTGSSWTKFPPVGPTISSGTSVPPNNVGADGDIYFRV